ncbi:hypothetical protein ACFOQM_08545 [Paenibacillus sp. GCM10012307]|uniref:Uncharacterized protein n=1 Tax=Paenibacillus roseus TaxID=2798579 RepID=A0A934J118_9BACL|nr:hypothetical protein [Paenibacillus roseus]MBJ6361334.1 hypothetical protein [Paenibacillus roseus]
MSPAIMPLNDFMNLETEEQVENLKRWKMNYKLKDIRDAWGFKHSAQYYMLLKKLRIYERVVNKSDKFFPDQLSAGREDAYRSFGYAQGQPVTHEPKGDYFDYQLNLTLSGPDVADRLERIAHFLKGENKRVHIRLACSVVSDESSGQEQQ